MRTKTEICRLLQGCRHILLGPFGLSLVLASPGWLGVPPAAAASEITDDQIVAAIKAQNNDKTPKLGMWDFGDLFSRESAHRTQNSLDLLAILRDPKSGDETRGYAAYYLGVLHAKEAVADLAAQITLNVPFRGGSLAALDAEWRYLPSAQALIAIGVPSIPAAIRNLAESDDAKVRDLSLMVLYRIERDKDVVETRLRKALAQQQSPNELARLQAAIKLLADPALEKRTQIPK